MAKQGITSDYIVVGAGSSGSVVTRRLLDRGFTVHVIEAGPAGTDPNIHNPQRRPMLLRCPQDWAFMATPQPQVNNRSVHPPRAKVLGGSRALQGMGHICTHRSY